MQVLVWSVWNSLRCCHCPCRSMKAMDFSWCVYVSICISTKINSNGDFGEAFLLLKGCVKECCCETNSSVVVSPSFQHVCGFVGPLQFVLHSISSGVLQFVRMKIFSIFVLFWFGVFLTINLCLNS